MTNLKTINIKGKEYVQVNDRIKAFRTMQEYAGWSLTSELKELTDQSCTVLATIIDQDGKVRATGLAREVVAKSPINKFAFVENCETSAWGRALGNLGIGIDSAICTAEELIQKMSQETPAEKAKATKAVNKEIKANDLDERFAQWTTYWKTHDWTQAANTSFRKFLDDAKDYDQDKLNDLVALFKGKAPESFTDSLPDWA